MPRNPWNIAYKIFVQSMFKIMYARYFFIPESALVALFARADLKRGLFPLFKQRVEARQNESKTVSFLNLNLNFQWFLIYFASRD